MGSDWVSCIDVLQVDMSIIIKDSVEKLYGKWVNSIIIYIMIQLTIKNFLKLLSIRIAALLPKLDFSIIDVKL